MILLDSNVVSAMMRLHREPKVSAWLARQHQRELHASTPTVFEVRFGIERKPPGPQRDSLQAAFDYVFGTMLINPVLVFDSAAAREAARLHALQIGRGNNVEVGDSQIAGIAVAHGAVVATRNAKDFNGLGLTVVDPWI